MYCSFSVYNLSVTSFFELKLFALQRTEEIFRDIVVAFGTRYLCAGGLLNSLNSDLADDEEYVDI